MVIADTGFWLALANRRDALHEAARSAHASLHEPLITTWPVVAETCHILLTRLGVRQQMTFIRLLAEGVFETFDLTSRHAVRIHHLMGRYANLPMDLADASLIILAEHLGHGRILSTDFRDFAIYRWKDRRSFENLLVVE
jgi:predicted nucleic acid-binding protein